MILCTQDAVLALQVCTPDPIHPIQVKCLSTQFKVLDVISGKSNLFEGQEKVCCHKNDMIVYAARLPDFSNSVSVPLLVCVQ